MENIRFDKDKHPSFRQQYEKIVGAYLRNELYPTFCNACFIGNLLNNTTDWALARDVKYGVYRNECNIYYNKAISCVEKEGKGLYTPNEIAKLENKFLAVLMKGEPGYNAELILLNQKDEELLYKATEITLLALKELHISKGEIVEDYTFEKRELQLNENI